MDRLDARPTWTFLTHHARVLILIARDPGIRLRDVADTCGLTERRVQGIVADLESAGYLAHTREGRRNRYRVIPGTHFRHPAEAGRQIAGLLALVIGETSLGSNAEPDAPAPGQVPKVNGSDVVAD